MSTVLYARTRLQQVGLVLGVVLFFLVLSLDLEPDKPVVTRMAAVAVLMATWWITEAIPLAATAVLPLLLFPILDILTGEGTAPLYFNSTIVLFMGGFMIALTMERWNLHKRIALVVIKTIGGGPPRIILGFMAASAFLSMWISNTATAVMMLPIGLSIVLQMESEFDAKETHNFSVGLMLGIAYAASVGGMATLVGTPPNLAFQRVFELAFPEGPGIAFGMWFIMALPLTLIMLAVIWVVITKILFRPAAHLKVDRNIVDQQLKSLGSMRFEERIVLLVFMTTALLWVFRKDLNLGFLNIPGWSDLLPDPKMIDDGTVALFMASLMFLVPTRSLEARAKAATLMDGSVFKNLPWGIIILFGGGFALAEGFQVTGLADYLGNRLQLLAGFPPLLMIALICLSLTFLTEVTSNTATTQMILPILASVGVAMGENPMLLMIPATLSASCAFMMPVATPPNAVVFGSGRVAIGDMVKAGFVINILGVIIISLMFYFLGTAVFSIEPGVQPDWAVSAAQ
ncbi:MAG: DASS family sodium-coupled anion symporter [Gammaproteobacteria bacterium]